MNLTDSQKIDLINESKPVHRLFDDILAEIFLAAVEEPQFSDPIVLSQVTRAWRNVAIHLPTLWTHVTITPSQNLHLLEAYLTRSQNCLLDISFDLERRSTTQLRNGDNVDNLVHSLMALISHVDRWRQFTVHLVSHAATEAIIVAIENLTAPNLTSFVIHLHSGGSPGELQDVQERLYYYFIDAYIFRGGASRLSHVECVGISIQSCWPPLAAVKTLHLESYTPPQFLMQDHFVQLLTSVHALTHLKLGSFVTEPEETDQLIIELPLLTSLEIELNYNDPFDDHLWHICAAISSPALTTLSVGSLPEYSAYEFVDVLQNSPRLPKYPILTHLEFKFADCVEVNRNFVEALPTITNLSFVSCDDTALALNRLIELDSTSTAHISWPRLNTLTITPYKQEWEQSFRSFILTRSRTGCPIANVRLDQSGISALREFLKEVSVSLA